MGDNDLETSASMEITVEKAGDVHVVALSGKLILPHTTTLDDSVRELIESGARKILFDCNDLSYAGSSGLGVFVNTANRLKKVEGKIAFANLNRNLTNVFDIVGFFDLFEVFSTREEALIVLGSFNPT
jgi:anti-sigma B factor antagonist